MKKCNLMLLLLLQVAGLMKVHAQNVGINATGALPDSSAMLDISSTKSGILIPRMTEAQKTAISKPAEGLMIYQNDNVKGFYYHNGAAWVHVAQAAGNLWSTTGNSGTLWTTNFLGTTDNNSLRFRTNNVQRFMIDSMGNVGIGTTTPAYKLQISADANPLALEGLQTGTNGDSVLIVSGGVIKRLSPAALTTSTSNVWSLLGNSVPSVQRLGTTSNFDLPFITNNTEKMRISAAGNVSIGTAPVFAPSPNLEKLLVDAGSTVTNPSSSYNVINGKGYINNYLQLNIQNRSPGTNASSDVVATADNGTETNNYVDMGINSSGNTSNYFGTANDAYLYNMGQNFLIGTGTAGKSLLFLTGGGSQSTNERMRIDGSGNVAIGSANFDEEQPEKLLVDGGTTSTNNLIGAYADVNDYVQIGVRNMNSGANASSDIVATADNGTNTTNYIDMGINSSGYANNASNILNRPNVGYLYTNATSDFFIGNGSPNQGMILFTNNGSAGNTTANGNEAMRIDGNGNIGIGGTSRNNQGIVTTNPERLVVSGNVVPRISGSGTLGTSTYRWNALYATNGTIQTSDRRLKTNISDLQYGLKEVLAMQPVSYNWKTTPDTDKKLGLIAQDVRKIIPEAVKGDEATENISMSYTDLIPVLINAIKEQQKQIEELKKLIPKL